MGDRKQLVIGLTAALVIIGVSVAVGKAHWVWWGLIVWCLIGAVYVFGMALYHLAVSVGKLTVTVVKHLPPKVRVGIEFIGRILWWLFAALMGVFVVLWFTIGGAWRLYLWVGLLVLFGLALMTVIASVGLAIEAIIRWFRRVNKAASFYEANREKLYRLLVSAESENTYLDRAKQLQLFWQNDENA